jgi:DNA-binding LacI/PurR family transcriptional regulator
MTQRVRRRRASNPPSVITVKEVAVRAGVSTATVSRVLSGVGGVADDLQRRVYDAAKALNYRPNRAARNLRAGSNHIIGVLIPDIENPFFTSVVCGIEEILQAGGFSLLLANFNESPEREQIHLASLRAEGIAGLIFAASREPAGDYRRLAEAGTPMVAVSRVPEGLSIDTVTVDNAGGARIAVSHLLSLGHRRIALINGPLSLNTARERQAGYEQAFHDAGLPVPSDLIRFGDFRQAGGYHAMQTLLAEGERPTAVFTASNLMTLGALEAIHERGLEIPSDIAVIGFDDMSWATSLRPPLTTVAQPATEVGRTAARLLLDRFQNARRPRRQAILQTQFLVRSSCGARSASIAR